jgi:UTP-glucose-1-phosphate uridylyltransferase
MQSIRVQEHWMTDGGMIGVVHNDAVWYDAGRPLPWLKAQIDHALRREDLAADLDAWLKSRLD